MILNIIVAILTYFKSYVYLPENFRVGSDENLFIFFQNGNKNCRVGTKNQGRSVGNTAIFFFRPN